MRSSANTPDSTKQCLLRRWDEQRARCEESGITIDIRDIQENDIRSAIERETKRIARALFDVLRIDAYELIRRSLYFVSDKKSQQHSTVEKELTDIANGLMRNKHQAEDCARLLGTPFIDSFHQMGVQIAIPETMHAWRSRLWVVAEALGTNRWMPHRHLLHALSTDVHPGREDNRHAFIDALVRPVVWGTDNAVAFARGFEQAAQPLCLETGSAVETLENLWHEIQEIAY